MNFEPKADFYFVTSPKPFPCSVIIWLKRRDGIPKCRSVQPTCSNSYTRLILMPAGLIVDIILCRSRFIAEYVHPTPGWNEEDNKPLLASMNLLYFGKSQDKIYVISLARMRIVSTFVSLFVYLLPFSSVRQRSDCTS